MFLPHFDILCDLLLNGHTATRNLFIFCNEQRRKTEWGRRHTYLILLDYSRICASLGILKSETLLFVPTSSFLLYYTCKQFAWKVFHGLHSFKTVGLSQQWHTLATVIKISFSLGIFKSSRTLFLLVSPLFLFVTSSCKPFLEAFTCLHWNSLANILKPHTMLNKTKKNNFPWHHPFVCTLTSRSWDHGQWPITARIIFTT